MNRLTLGMLAALLLDVALLAVSIIHLPDLLHRPRSPVILIQRGPVVVVDRILDPRAATGASIGDTVLALDGRSIRDESEIEFLCDFRRIGDRIPLTLSGSQDGVEPFLVLIPFFTLRYVVIVLLVGLVTWGVGVFVLLTGPAEVAGRVLHAALVCMAVAVMMMWGRSPAGSVWTLIDRGLYFVSYGGVAATFCYFTTLFPRPWAGSIARRGALILVPALVLTAIPCVQHVRALSSGLIEDFQTFRRLFDLFRLSIVLYVALGIVNLIRAYAATESRTERKKLRWVLFACTIGPAPFLGLVVIPEFFMPVSRVPEEYTLIFLIVIPVAFAVSFVKYHLLDIDVVISRTTVYAIAVGAMLVAYTVLVGAVAYLIGTYTLEAAAIAAVVTALGFEPARRRAQRFVDRRFFRVEYDFRQTERRLVESLKRAAGLETLGEMLVREIDALIPLERIGFFVLVNDQSRVRLVAHRNFGILEGRGVRFSRAELRARLEIPVGLREEIEPGVGHVEGDAAVFTRWGLVLIIPMLSQEGAFLGFLGLGRKKSAARFSAEDIDLLVNISTQAGLEVERIGLQQQVVREQAEALRQKALNEMKTEFVRMVTHELKTPLTAIKLCAELLREKMPPKVGKAVWCIDTIEGETDRLDRMVTTILTSARVEREAMTYAFAEEDLGEIITSVLGTMQYQLKKDDFRVETAGLTRSRRYPVSADRDAVAEAIMNLIANAIKYSAERKYLKVSVARHGDAIECTVEDRGVGISAEALPHIFEKYYRDPASAGVAGGIGLGLPLVRSIMESHQGTVRAASRPGEGSTFTLVFPARPSGGESSPPRRGERDHHPASSLRNET